MGAKEPRASKPHDESDLSRADLVAFWGWAAATLGLATVFIAVFGSSAGLLGGLVDLVSVKLRVNIISSLAYFGIFALFRGVFVLWRGPNGQYPEALVLLIMLWLSGFMGTSMVSCDAFSWCP